MSHYLYISCNEESVNSSEDNVLVKEFTVISKGSEVETRYSWEVRLACQVDKEVLEFSEIPPNYLPAPVNFYWVLN